MLFKTKKVKGIFCMALKMIKCFKKGCEKQFFDCESYKCHLKIKHIIEASSEYNCTFPRCDSNFSRLSNFMRHLQDVHSIKSHHLDQIEVAATTVTPKQQDSDLPSSQSSTSTTQQDNVNFEESPEGCNSISVMKENFTDFLIKLHTRGNMTKKLTMEIFHDLKAIIVDPIAIYLNASEAQKSEINEVFSSLNSLYKFEKVLLEKKSFQESRKNQNT